MRTHQTHSANAKDFLSDGTQTECAPHLHHPKPQYGLLTGLYAVSPALFHDCTPSTTATPSVNPQMTPRWWGSCLCEMNRPAGTRWCRRRWGAETTTCFFCSIGKSTDVLSTCVVQLHSGKKPSLEELHNTRCLRKSQKHFVWLITPRRCSTIKSRTMLLPHNYLSTVWIYFVYIIYILFSTKCWT